MPVVLANPDQEPLRPNGDGDYTEWTISDSTHAGATSDNSDTTYVYSSTAAQREYLNLDDMVATPSTINWVQVIYKCYASGSKGGEKVDLFIKSDSTFTETDANIVITRDSWNNVSGTQQTVNPATASAWQKSEVDAMQAGIVIDTIGSGEEIRCSEIWVVVDYSAGDSTAPSFTYAGTTNNSDAQFNVVHPIGNWSITEINPDKYIIFSNSTGSNQTKASGSYSNGDYKSWTYSNTNTSNIGNTIFIQIWANDTASNSASSIVFFSIVEYDPVITYDTTTSTTNNSNVEFGTSILANWSITDADPNNYWIYANDTGSNVTKDSGAYGSGQYKSWSYGNTNVTNIGNTIYIQIWTDDDGGYSASSIVYFNIIESVIPSFTYVGSTNNSQIQIGTSIIGNWSIIEPNNPDIHEIYANNTGTNSTKASGSYNNGDYKSWIYNNVNCSNVGNTIFIEIWANDTYSNFNSSIVYFDILSDTPQWAYTGDINNTDWEWETQGVFTASWDITENSPDKYVVFSNHSGANTTYASGSYTTSVNVNFDPNLNNVSNTVFLQLYVNDTCSNSNTSIVFLTVVNTSPPTISISSPENTTYTGNVTITLESTSQDQDQFWYAIYYADDTPHTGNTTWTETIEISLDPTIYYLVGYMNDSAGLEDSSTVYFTISEVNTNSDDPPGGATVVKKQKPFNITNPEGIGTVVMVATMIFSALSWGVRKKLLKK